MNEDSDGEMLVTVAFVVMKCENVSSLVHCCVLTLLPLFSHASWFEHILRSLSLCPKLCHFNQLTGCNGLDQLTWLLAVETDFFYFYFFLCVLCDISDVLNPATGDLT